MLPGFPARWLGRAPRTDRRYVRGGAAAVDVVMARIGYGRCGIVRRQIGQNKANVWLGTAAEITRL
jgi:hypothetical protein